MPIQTLAEALSALGVVDSFTATLVEKGMVKLLRQMARTGNRVVIVDKRKFMMMIETGDYGRNGEPHPKLRVRFDKDLQAMVRQSQSEPDDQDSRL